jgi:Rod binding domain-containing protein
MGLGLAMQTGTIGGSLARQQDSAPQPRLVRAAHEFEGLMMNEILKPMIHGDGLTGGDDGDGSGGVMGQFAGDSLGQAISQRGGFGIADRIIGQLSHSGKPVG